MIDDKRKALFRGEPDEETGGPPFPGQQPPAYLRLFAVERLVGRTSKEGLCGSGSADDWTVRVVSELPRGSSGVAGTGLFTRYGCQLPYPLPPPGAFHMHHCSRRSLLHGHLGWWLFG